MEHHRIVDARAVEAKIREHFIQAGGDRHGRPVEQMVEKVLPMICSRNVADVAFALSQSPQQAYVMQGTLTLAQSLVDLVEDVPQPPSAAFPALTVGLRDALEEALAETGCSAYDTTVSYLVNFFKAVNRHVKRATANKQDKLATIDGADAWFFEVERCNSQSRMWRALTALLPVAFATDDEAHNEITRRVLLGRAVLEVYPAAKTEQFVTEQLRLAEQAGPFIDDLKRIAHTLNVAPDLEAVEIEIERLKTMSEAWGTLAAEMAIDVDVENIVKHVRSALNAAGQYDELHRKLNELRGATGISDGILLRLLETDVKTLAQVRGKIGKPDTPEDVIRWVEGAVAIIERLGGWTKADARLDQLDKDADRVVNLVAIGTMVEREKDEWRKIAQTLAARPVAMNAG